MITLKMAMAKMYNIDDGNDNDDNMITMFQIIFFQANFAEESKADADAMVENLRSAFKELVNLRCDAHNDTIN